MSKKLFLMSASSNSGKTVLANGLLNIAAKQKKKVQFYKPLSIDSSHITTSDHSIAASYISEFSQNAGVEAQAKNNTAFYDTNSKILYCHGEPICQTTLVTQDNIDCGNLSIEVVNGLKKSIFQDLSELSMESDILIAEGGGNCLLGDQNEFSNRWPATTFQFSVVLVIEGRDGGGFLSLVGLKALMPAELQNLVAGFVVNGVIARTKTIDKKIEDLVTATEWPCLGILPWFNFDENQPYEAWQSALENQLHLHARPLLSLLETSETSHTQESRA